MFERVTELPHGTEVYSIPVEKQLYTINTRHIRGRGTFKIDVFIAVFSAIKHQWRKIHTPTSDIVTIMEVTRIDLHW